MKHDSMACGTFNETCMCLLEKKWNFWDETWQPTHVREIHSFFSLALTFKVLEPLSSSDVPVSTTVMTR